MSLDQVRARTTEIELRLRALSVGTSPGGTLGAAGPAADVFAGQLQAATARVSPSSSSSPLRTGAGVSVLRGSGTTTSGSATGEDVVATAESKAGTPYVWGGESLAEGGFDCSGLVQWAYKQHGIDLPRVSSDQARAGHAVSAAEARPGDLVFFAHSGRPDHIGMYAGGGEWIVAPKTGDVVKRQKVDLSQATTIRRVLPEAGLSALRGAGAPAAQPGWSRALPAAGQRYAPLVESAAAKAGVDPRLLASLAWTESGFDPQARSGAGATGLVQLMPATARGLGVTDPTDAAQSLAGGAAYLKQQLDAFGGDAELALAAYNAGPTAVRRHGGVPPYAETQKYVTTVLDRYRSLGGTP
ncbi:MAG: Lytic transglycosylase catalytic [Frankiales bacterium]|nr:Lytic transglycosylase catalytic [Frankiales bacterium]